QGVDHELQQLFDFRLETPGFWLTHKLFISIKNKKPKKHPALCGRWGVFQEQCINASPEGLLLSRLPSHDSGMPPEVKTH
ncbi:MAG: hypothetical protein IE913_09165, partial [Halothiobacillus sp.]|nr:hypothetical protein [Halothiobacillus sp.]